MEPRRLSIPGCIGCGAMRQYESCEGACSERRLELVSGSDYDELTAVAAACHVRIEGFGGSSGNWRAQSPARARCGSRMRRFSSRRVRCCGAAGLAGGRGDDPPSPETVIVWRCEDCGGVDVPRPSLAISVVRWFPVILSCSAAMFQMPVATRTARAGQAICDLRRARRAKTRRCRPVGHHAGPAGQRPCRAGTDCVWRAERLRLTADRSRNKNTIESPVIKT